MIKAGWEVVHDTFKENTQTNLGIIEFSNIIATLNPNAPERIVFACHYDSKYVDASYNQFSKSFIGTSDAAVPCAMILDIAFTLTPLFKNVLLYKNIIKI